MITPHKLMLLIAGIFTTLVPARSSTLLRIYIRLSQHSCVLLVLAAGQIDTSDHERAVAGQLRLEEFQTDVHPAITQFHIHTMFFNAGAAFLRGEAERLGLKPTTLESKMRKLGIERGT